VKVRVGYMGEREQERGERSKKIKRLAKDMAASYLRGLLDVMQ